MPRLRTTIEPLALLLCLTWLAACPNDSTKPSDLATPDLLTPAADLTMTAPDLGTNGDLPAGDLAEISTDLAVGNDLTTSDLVITAQDAATGPDMTDDPCGTATTGTGFAITNATPQLNHLQRFDTPHLGVVLVNATSATTINVLLGVPLDTTSAETLAHWSISPPLTITGAVASSSLVTLTTEAQTPGQSYTLTIDGVKDEPLAATLTNVMTPFTGYAFHATAAPLYTSVPAGQMYVLFSDTVACSDAQNVANYTFDGDPITAILSVPCANRTSLVTLLLPHGFRPGPHTLSLSSALVDKFGHAPTPLDLTVNGTGQTAPLFIADASATSDAVVELAFNDNLDSASAMTVGNYTVTPSTALSSATVANSSSVQLGGFATSPNELYAIDVANVLANGGSVSTSIPTAYAWGWQSFYPTTVYMLKPHELRIYFSDSVHKSTSAGTASNYVIDGGVTATAVTADNLQAIVTLTGDQPGQSYTVDLSALTSAAGVPMSQGFAGIVTIALDSAADRSVVPTVIVGSENLTAESRVVFLDDTHLLVQTGLLGSGAHSVRVCGLDNAGHTSHLGKVDVPFTVP